MRYGTAQVVELGYNAPLSCVYAHDVRGVAELADALV